MKLNVIILAAGMGKRMHSELPKVLHTLAGKTLLQHVLDTVQDLNPEKTHVVIGHQKLAVQEACQGYPNINWVTQDKQLGTGHAVQCAIDNIADNSLVLVLCGDVPLIGLDTLNALLQNVNSLNLLTANLDNPYGLGRILRDHNGAIIGIREEKDASIKEKEITEIYSGILAGPAKLLKKWLKKLTPNNAQKEYYLTDIIAMAHAENFPIASSHPKFSYEIQGVNDRMQLHDLERIYQYNNARNLLLNGVQISDINRIDIRGTLKCDEDVKIDVNCVFIGNVILGKGTIVHPFSVLQDCTVGEHCEIGPFARIRPNTHIDKNCKVGNFVEIKNSKIAEYSKINHLSYIGDAIIGNKVNIGAGTITCNYDGVQKHRTTIAAGAFIGSGTQLVAPITVGANAVIGAGTTLRKDAPADALTLTKSEQKTIPGWQVKKISKNADSA
jgi:bifunctional UDP-N-acetylglucosamine pyrophosphorylase/glucosamine-1-phosphate N-acetyltransferase